MARSNLFQVVKSRKSQKGVPELLTGVHQLLGSLCPSRTLAAIGLCAEKAVFALGQKIRQAPSEQAYVSQPETESAQRAYNRFLQKASAQELLSLLISRVPKKFFSGSEAIWGLDDTPLKKSGPHMEKAGKFYHNGVFYHGYELPVLVSHTSQGVFPLGFALKGKNCPSKIELSKNLLQAALNRGFSQIFWSLILGSPLKSYWISPMKTAFGSWVPSRGTGCSSSMVVKPLPRNSSKSLMTALTRISRSRFPTGKLIASSSSSADSLLKKSKSNSFSPTTGNPRPRSLPWPTSNDGASKPSSGRANNPSPWRSSTIERGRLS